MAAFFISISMESFRSWLLDEMAQVQRISPEEAKSKKMFGPVYHGTSSEKRQSIAQDGFKLFKGLPRTGDISNGYQKGNYADNAPPPIHHLGFGIYLTTKPSIAKQYNLGTSSGLIPYYIYAPRMEIINYGAPNTMMKWWRANGYTGTNNMSEEQWMKATEDLTNNLASKYDAVWFKGKGLRTLLDGDQIVVFNPDNIYQLDNSLSPGYDTGNGTIIRPQDRVLLKNTKITVKVSGIEPLTREDYWKDILGPSRLALITNISAKQVEQIKSIYFEPFKKSLEKHMDDAAIQNRLQTMGPKDALNHYATYFFNVLNRQMPSALVDRVLKPRERA